MAPANIPLKVYKNNQFDGNHPANKVIKNPNNLQNGTVVECFGYLQSGNY